MGSQGEWNSALFQSRGIWIVKNKTRKIESRIVRSTYTCAGSTTLSPNAPFRALLALLGVYCVPFLQSLDPGCQTLQLSLCLRLQPDGVVQHGGQKVEPEWWWPNPRHLSHTVHHPFRVYHPFPPEPVITPCYPVILSSHRPHVLLTFSLCYSQFHSTVSVNTPPDSLAFPWDFSNILAHLRTVKSCFSAFIHWYYTSNAYYWQWLWPMISPSECCKLCHLSL